MELQQVLSRDSQDFESYHLNSLLPWAFSQQDKKIKIIVLLSLVLILSISLTIKSTNLKNLILEFAKSRIKTLLTWLMYLTFYADFPIALHLMKSNGSVSLPLLNILETKIYSKATIYVNEPILNPFSSFDIKCKKLNLMWKTSEDVILGHLGGWVFHIFPRLQSIMWQ